MMVHFETRTYISGIIDYVDINILHCPVKVGCFAYSYICIAMIIIICRWITY